MSGADVAGSGLPIGHRPWRWPRLLAIAVAAVALASCRSITRPAVAPLATAVALASADAEADDRVGEQRAHRDPEESHTATPPAAAPRRPAAAAESASRTAGWEREAAAALEGDSAVRQAGCETPCPPLPRLIAGPGPRGGCNSCGRGAAACGEGSCGPCPPVACVAQPAAVPVVGPCLVCDGGDHGAPAVPVARFGLKNLTAGDTVARYRADDRFGADEVHVTASNCACVYAPRFGSVRQVTQPHEEAKPVGPRGLALDTGTEARVDLQPVCRTAQWIAPEAARKAQPGVALEERLGPLAVDQGGMPHESDGRERPAERVRDDQPERTALTEGPRTVTGFDVPLVWTCARSVNVMLGRQQAEVVAADRGTATLRLESPGRAELTLCKRAGTDTARVGEEIDFMIYLHNSGDRPLTDIVLVDTLPGRLELVPDSAAANQPAEFGTETGDDGAVVLKWRFNHTFRPGEGGFVRFRTLVR
jgi:uncharacterized repeat protein (TIGR01451 family)